jgi:uncharacterized protein (DUF924 family)
MSSYWIDDVLGFWFSEIPREAWFRKDDAFDKKIATRFGELHEQISRNPPPDVSNSPEAALAAVIVLDQFSRNMFRGTPKAFASDALALRIAQGAIDARFDQRLTQDQRVFLYLPFEHSEDRTAQARSLELYTALGVADYLPYAKGHKDIIDRFGRFPHRNAILGRISTPEEVEFMKTHKGY